MDERYRLTEEEITADICADCLLEMVVVNEKAADESCRECQRKLRKVETIAASKAARLAREDALREVGEWLDKKDRFETFGHHWEGADLIQDGFTGNNIADVTETEVTTLKSGQLPASLRSESFPVTQEGEGK